MDLIITFLVGLVVGALIDFKTMRAIVKDRERQFDDLKHAALKLAEENTQLRKRTL